MSKTTQNFILIVFYCETITKFIGKPCVLDICGSSWFLILNASLKPVKVTGLYNIEKIIPLLHCLYGYIAVFLCPKATVHYNHLKASKAGSMKRLCILQAN